MSDHPASYLLEELAAGVAAEAGATEAHVAACAACREHVERLRRAAEAFAASPEGDAHAFVEKVALRRENASLRPIAPTVRRLVWSRVAWVAAPLAAAAILLLVVKPTPEGAPPDRLLVGPPLQRFKGAVPQLAAVVERGAGGQERLTGEVHVHPGDRLRLEVSVEGARPIVAGVLESDGTWTPLLAPAELQAGTHFSDQAARVDDSLKGGWLLAGDPLEVERARASRDFHAVAVLPLVRVP